LARAKSSRLLPAFLSLLSFLIAAPFALAQEAELIAPPAKETLDAIQQKIEEGEGWIEQNAGAAPETLSALEQGYAEARKGLEAARTWIAEAETSLQSLEEAPAVLKRIREGTEPPPAPPLPEGADLSEWTDRYKEAEAALEKARQNRKTLLEEKTRRDERRAGLPEKLAEARRRLDEARNAVSEAPEGTGPGDPARAERTKRLAWLAASRAQLFALDAERRSYEAREEVLEARLEDALREVSRAEERVETLGEVVRKRKRLEVEADFRRAREAALEAADAPPAVRALAEDVAELAGRRASSSGPIAKIEAETERLERTRETLASLAQDFENVRKRVEKVGMTRALGLLLRARRASMPSTNARRRSIRARQSELEQVQWDLIELEEALADLRDPGKALAPVKQALEGPGEAERERWLDFSRKRLAAKREVVRGLQDDTASLFVLLVDLDAAEQQLVKLIDTYEAYIDERILWVRSSTPMGLADLERAPGGFFWIFRRGHGNEILSALIEDLKENPIPFAAGALLVAAVFALRLSLSRRLRATATGRFERFLDTVKAFLITGLLGASGPALVAFLAWRLQASPGGGDFAKAVGDGLAGVASLWLPAAVLRQACRKQGLGASHFKWPAESLAALRQHLAWLLATVLPLAFVAGVLGAQDAGMHKETLGRLAFMAGMILLAVFSAVALRPGSAFASGLFARAPRGWLRRLRHLWFGASVVLPLLLAVLAAFGYFYSARFLAERLFETAWLFLALLLGHAFVTRWFFFLRRRMARAVQKRKREEASDTAEEEAPEEDVPPVEEDLTLDLSTIRLQVSRFLRYATLAAALAGLWLIWANVVPALGMLERVELWSVTETVTETAALPDGTETARAVEKAVPVTLADALLALLAGIFTVLAARNLPGLLQVSVLDRLPVDPGAVYAMRTVFMYALFLSGLVIVIGMVGVQWSSIQWLVAAMGVGLGFGLQEIFANFISGLILLFERPLRIGDTVTVGDVSGTVTRIRMRATTIRDWDRKELVIPNKEFITGQLINWTLSDKILRIIVPVGVAYGSDTRKAREILLRVAAEHPDVLEDPGPQAFFLGFGDSTLNLDLRVFVPSIGFLLNVKHDLHTAIDDAFREAGIEIAFPQQDVHLRSLEAPLTVVDARGGEGKPS